MFKNYVQVALLGSVIAALGGCATTADQAPVDSLSGANADGSVKTAGLGDGFATKDGKFGGADTNSANTSKDAAGNLSGCTLTVGNQIYYFDFNKSNVRDQDMACLKVQADYLNAHPDAKVLLEGNTDPRGSREYNVALGQNRADAIDAVLKQDGVSESQLRSVSYGAEKLASQGQTDADYALDRRVTLDYVQK